MKQQPQEGGKKESAYLKTKGPRCSRLIGFRVAFSLRGFRV